MFVKIVSILSQLKNNYDGIREEFRDMSKASKIFVWVLRAVFFGGVIYLLTRVNWTSRVQMIAELRDMAIISVLWGFVLLWMVPDLISDYEKAKTEQEQASAWELELFTTSLEALEEIITMWERHEKRCVERENLELQQTFAQQLQEMYADRERLKRRIRELSGQSDTQG